MIITRETVMGSFQRQGPKFLAEVPMKSIITTAMMVLVAAVYLITWSGLSETWAKGPAGKSKSTSRVSNAPPASAGVSSKKAVSAKKKKSSGDKLEYMKYEMKDAFITGF